jgi:lipopolysaccharide export system permease protein
VAFGILQRYVTGEVVRAFAMALLTMTIIFVLFMVMAEAARFGLSPADIATLVRFVIPSTLPYTVPVSMLFAVTVVFGRLASDNEVIAVKTAGLSAWTILWPAFFMGGSLSAALLALGHDAIPRSTHQAKLTIFKNFEDAFYKFLKMEREFNNPEWPFLIKVKDVDVDTRTMYEATFKHRAKKGGSSQHTYDMTVKARTAKLRFDMDAGEAHIYLEGATISGGHQSEDVVLINGEELVFDIPDKNNQGYEKRIQEWTTPEMVAEQANLLRKIRRERKRQAMIAALWIGSGRFERVKWEDIQEAFVNHGYWEKKLKEFETEKQLRVAQSFGSLVFVVLGAPVGIRFARRDFLSAFISCFVPIIILYYPLMLLGVNLGKEGVLNPTVALWGGNALLAVLAGFVLPPVFKH